MSDYEELVSKSDKFSMVLRSEEFDHMNKMNETTSKVLIDRHLQNIEENIKSGLWDKHGPMSFGLRGIGKDKATIGIGAGPSYNLNSAVLKSVHDLNMMKSVDDQPFLFMCSNHQWKPCIQQGIYPHFVVIVDAGDVLLDQLCSDIPAKALNTILLTGLHCSPKMLKEWDKQGRPIQFYVPKYEIKREKFVELTGEDPDPFICEEGGNVMNQAWIVSRKFLCSSVFITVGNDMAFPIELDPGKRRRSFYADGDYSSNIKNKRDEARHKMAWMGFKYEHNPIIDRDVINLVPQYTSWQLWVYKKWIETQVTLCDGGSPDQSFHYYNCSESGILGVVAKDMNKENFNDKSNWILMDQILPKRWHTRKLSTAVGEFLKARDMLCGKKSLLEDRVVIPTDAEGVAYSQARTDTARTANHGSLARVHL